ncbi:hypothetical protein M422DRAFT_782913 [Sphaerobolus stellatus SS14]|uniref:Cytochrome P450 n=1 Tax=Sphaerobolus stellatus (strain SS14) TaxID=990650 RepID=A0A0C9UY98_SPHS4|nr:hypothetical protein M422DRAFT_782913 [Sphaerobolus stellatus SS14]
MALTSGMEDALNLVSHRLSGIRWSNKDVALPVIFCLLGYSVLHYLNAGRRSKLSPPHVGHWIPWVGSAITMGKDPDTFLKRASEKLGPIFRVTAAGNTMTYVTSPELISAIYRDSKNFAFFPFRLELSERIFGMSHDSVHSLSMTEEYFTMHHDELSPRNSAFLLHRYIKQGHIHILDAINTFNGKTTPLLPFLHLAAYHSAAYAFFGYGLDVPKSYECFRKFDESTHLMIAGMPRILLPGPFRARDEGIKVFEEYLKTPLEDDCSPVIKRSREISQEAGWSLHDRAAVLFTEMWATQTNYLNSAYWIIALLLQHPETLISVKAEIEAARTAWQVTHPDEDPEHQNDWMLDGASFPLLTSAVQETLRYSSSIFSIRIVQEPVQLRNVCLEKGEKVLSITRAVHMDEEIHQNPEKFIADRYLGGSKLRYKNGKPVANHTMAFGGGVSMCEGRHFASGGLRIFAAFIFTYANIEIDPTSSERPEPMTSRMGGGILAPLGDLRVTITKRDF